MTRHHTPKLQGKWRVPTIRAHVSLLQLIGCFCWLEAALSSYVQDRGTGSLNKDSALTRGLAR